jgi:hypothetical protein
VVGRFGLNGERIWIKTFNEGDSIGWGVRIIKQPPYYIVGCGLGYMKIDDQGNVITAKLVPLDPDYGIRDLQFITNDKFVMVTNNLAVVGTCLTKLYVVDTLRNIIDSQSVMFSDFIRLRKIVQAGNGDFIFGGDASRYDTSHLDIYALRTDGNLNFPPIGIQNFSGEIPAEFKLFQNFPNPFNPKTTIKYDLPKDGFVTFKVYDVLGKELYSVTEHKSAGTYQITLDGTNYASGLYFYRIESGSFVETKKMVLIK